MPALGAGRTRAGSWRWTGSGWTDRRGTRRRTVASVEAVVMRVVDSRGLPLTTTAAAAGHYRDGVDAWLRVQEGFGPAMLAAQRESGVLAPGWRWTPPCGATPDRPGRGCGRRRPTHHGRASASAATSGPV